MAHRLGVVSGALLVAICHASFVFATTFYVDASVLSSGEGLSWEAAFKTIQEAIEASSNGDRIIVAEGVYRECVSFTGKAIALESQNPFDWRVVAATVLDGRSERSPVVTFSSGEGNDSAIAGFTITGGCSAGGGGILCVNSSPTISHNRIEVNHGDYESKGGGILCDNASPVIVGNIIADNFAVLDGTGGGICCTNGSSPTIKNNLIVRNSAEIGAGVSCENASSPRIENCVIAQNRGPKGQGIYASQDSNPTIVNCILWNNGDDLSGCSATYSCIQNADPGEGNISGNPHFVDAENGDYHLLSWSPCIDTGHPASDFSNEPQPNGGRIDMGAYGNTSEATAKSPDADGDDLPDAWELLWFGVLGQTAADDPDGDLIPNASELAHAWNPSSPAETRVENLRSGVWYETIQSAIAESQDGDELVVHPGTYPESINFLGRAVTLRSMDPLDDAVRSTTVISSPTSESTVSFVSGEGADSVIMGLAITSAKPHGDLGGVYCEGSSPTISKNVFFTLCEWPDEAWQPGICCMGGSSPLIADNVISENRAAFGGGIRGVQSSPTIVGNTIKDNWGVAVAGGIYLEGCTSVVIKDNVISGNSGLLTGGIFARNTSMVVENNVITDNVSRWPGGGGIDCENSTAEIIGNVISNNGGSLDAGGIHADTPPDSPAGIEIVGNIIVSNWSETWSDSEFLGPGGIFVANGSPLIAGNVIANSYGRLGEWPEASWGKVGASAILVAAGASPTITNNTIVDNLLYGIECQEGASPIITNCILWGNARDLSRCSATYSCIEDTGENNEGEGNIHSDPMFVNPSRANYHLLRGSPCIDSASSLAQGIPRTDIDGETRPFIKIDIGADEFIDTDWDGLLDYWEKKYFGWIIATPSDDPDADGLTNAQEFLACTDPCNPDTDSDGHPDGEELSAGTDPLDPQSFFRVVGLILDKPNLRVQWASAPGKHYRLYLSKDLVTWYMWRQDFFATDTTTEAVMLDGVFLPACFYRVELLNW